MNERPCLTQPTVLQNMLWALTEGEGVCLLGLRGGGAACVFHLVFECLPMKRWGLGLWKPSKSKVPGSVRGKKGKKREGRGA